MCKKWNLFFIILIFVFGCKNQLDDFYKNPDISKFQKDKKSTDNNGDNSDGVIYNIHGTLAGLAVAGKIAFLKNNEGGLSTKIIHLKVGDDKVEADREVEVKEGGSLIKKKAISHVKTSKIESTKLNIIMNVNFEKDILKALSVTENQPTNMEVIANFSPDFKSLDGNIAFDFLIEGPREKEFEAIINIKDLTGNYSVGDINIIKESDQGPQKIGELQLGKYNLDFNKIPILDDKIELEIEFKEKDKNVEVVPGVLTITSEISISNVQVSNTNSKEGTIKLTAVFPKEYFSTCTFCKTLNMKDDEKKVLKDINTDITLIFNDWKNKQGTYELTFAIPTDLNPLPSIYNEIKTLSDGSTSTPFNGIFEIINK
jgi:hypothetical protein